MTFSDQTSFAVLQEKFGGGLQLVVSTDAVTAANKALIRSGRLFVGDRTFPNGSLTADAFDWYVASPCTSLPQGEGISFRYELYDGSGAIIQKSSAAVVAKISTC